MTGEEALSVTGVSRREGKRRQIVKERREKKIELNGGYGNGR